MPLPPGRARAFETAGKQGCDCVAWSRKRRTGFISRQGVYESPVPRPTPDFGTKIRYNNFRKLKSKQKKTWFAALW